MVKSKYTFEKRQKEIARQKKQEEKAKRKAEAKRSDEVSSEEPPVEGDTADSL
ncbi:MAG: hypothetical protein CSYNP_02599 [Syntrophus sp. SKADARSKE-3]|nr:hypothetical protein [Syntrophus sp. SKADARSKE-3]